MLQNKTSIIKALDLFAGGGGAGMGIMQALGERCQLTGVDIGMKGAKYYPGKYICADVFILPDEFFADFDYIWSSPPCQHFSPMTLIRGDSNDHPDLIAKTRDLLKRVGTPYVIENVVGAPLNYNLMLCGLMFGLELYRHRIFETSFPVTQPDHPKHGGQQKFSVVGRPSSSRKRDGEDKEKRAAAYREILKTWPEAMGIYHITPNSRCFAEAIPPAFSRYITKEFLTIHDGQVSIDAKPLSNLYKLRFMKDTKLF